MQHKIPLANGEFLTVVDTVDYSIISEYRWYIGYTGNAKPGTQQKLYAKTRIRNLNDIGSKTVFMHRLIGERIKGDRLASGEYVMHLDGDTLNNTRSNLVIVNKSDIMRKSNTNYETNTTGYRGVSLHRRTGKFQARAWVNGKREYIGLFNSPNEAAIAIKNAQETVFTPPVT